MKNELKKVKNDLIVEIDKRIVDKIIEKTNADLLKKLITSAETVNEAIMIAELGTTYKRTGFHFDKRLEKMTDTIKYFKKNKKLSFAQDKSALTHKLIIGDNYDALLNLLIEYRGGIDVIYIDPPYGKDSMGEFAQTNYENAITRDNLLSMLYPRLVLARQLLSDNGIIFCSIDDKNQAYVKGLFDEVFEERNFVANFIWNSTKSVTNTAIVSVSHTYNLCYVKDKDWLIKNREFFRVPEEGDGFSNPDNDPRGPWKADPFQVGGWRPNQQYDIVNPKTGKVYKPNKNSSWKNDFIKYQELIRDNRIVFGVNGDAGPQRKRFLSEAIERGKVVKTLWDIWDDIETTTNGTQLLKKIFDGESLFDNPKPIELLERLFILGGDENSIILDFFAGSGTTGQAVLELNKKDGGKRQFILATANEITETTPNGIVNDVTSKRLKRVMTGECHDGAKDFKWNEENEPLGDNLDVYDITTVAPYSDEPFTQIDETLYGKEKLGVNEKIKWVCENFEGTQKTLKDK